MRDSYRVCCEAGDTTAASIRSADPTCAATQGSAIPNILLADDDRVTLFIMEKGLREAGYLVLPASSGEEALRIASETRPDLAILDISMPGMCGMEVALRLRETCAIPVIFLSSHREPDVVREAAKTGALAYLTKPLDPAQVASAVALALVRAAENARMQSAHDALTTALVNERETNTAIGVLMERYRVDRSSAFNLLRSYARRCRRKVVSVAAELLRCGDIPDLLRSGRRAKSPVDKAAFYAAQQSDS